MSEAIGHNSHDSRLKSLVARIAHLTVEKAGIASDIKDLYTEAKSAGYDVKGLRDVVKRYTETAEQAEKRRRTEDSVETMLAALGSFSDLPLGQSAIERVTSRAA